MPTIHLYIKGRVQGVFYRVTAKKVADKIGITGWIKNRKDDDVEAMATGTQEQLDEFIEWCRRGPEKAEVDEVILTPLTDSAFNNFIIVKGY
ncbi:MAG: acylphosphatase [Bacteroidota bacterium]|nr:acylphosphatase [Bacteroidota bacterium]